MAELDRPGDAGDPADDDLIAEGVADDEVTDADADDLEDDDAEAVGGGGTAVREKSKKKAKDEKKPGKVGFFGRIGRFFREVVSELRKVIWPTRKELLTYTTIVIGFVTVMTTLVGVLDWALGKGILKAFGG